MPSHGTYFFTSSLTAIICVPIEFCTAIANHIFFNLMFFQTWSFFNLMFSSTWRFIQCNSWCFFQLDALFYLILDAFFNLMLSSTWWFFNLMLSPTWRSIQFNSWCFFTTWNIFNLYIYIIDMKSNQFVLKYITDLPIIRVLFDDKVILVVFPNFD